jgi:hypothetical protein
MYIAEPGTASPLVGKLAAKRTEGVLVSSFLCLGRHEAQTEPPLSRVDGIVL